MFEISNNAGKLAFSVVVVPRSSKSEIVGLYDGALKIRLAAPPVEGAANVELVRLLAKELGIAKSGVEIVSGASSRRKTVSVEGVPASDLERLARGPR